MGGSPKKRRPWAAIVHAALVARGRQNGARSARGARRQAQIRLWIFSYHDFAKWPNATLSRLMLLRSRSLHHARPLHIGAARRHAEFLAANLGEHRHAGPDGVVRGMREAQPHPALAVGFVGRPFGARI